MFLAFFMHLARVKNCSNGGSAIISVLWGRCVAVLLEFPVAYVSLLGVTVASQMVWLVAVEAQVGIPMLLLLCIRQAATDCPSSLLVSGLNGINIHGVRVTIMVSSVSVSIGLAVELESQVIPLLHSARESSLSQT